MFIDVYFINTMILCFLLSLLSFIYRFPTGKFDISVSLRNTGGKAVENILLEIPLGTSVSNIYATCNVGSYIFDPATKVGALLIGAE